MKHRRAAIAALLLALTLAGHADEACSSCLAPKLPAAEAAPEAGHPLRGVIVAVLPEKSALLVNHEEIPGVMAAMTMLLKVDAPTHAAAKQDATITATLVKKTDGWWLESVQAAPAR
jgi:hypothetical protein